MQRKHVPDRVATGNFQLLLQRRSLWPAERETDSPFPQIDIIGAMMIVRRVRGEIIRSVLCNIVHNSCAVHTHMNRPNSSLDCVFLTGPISLRLDSFLYVRIFVYHCILHVAVL